MEVAKIINKINKLRPTKKQVKGNVDYAYGFVDAINSAIELLNNEQIKITNIPIEPWHLMALGFERDSLIGYRYIYSNSDYDIVYDLDDNCIRICECWDFGKKEYVHEMQELLKALTGNDHPIDL